MRWGGLILSLVIGAASLQAQEPTISAPLLPVQVTVSTQYDAPYQVGFNGDGSQLAALSAATEGASAGLTALQWYSSGQESVLTREGQSLYQFAFHPFLPQLVTTTVAGEVALWDTTTLSVTSSVLGHESAPQVVFAPDGQHFVTLDWSGVIIWSGTNGEPTFFLPTGNSADDTPSPLAISPDGQYVAWVTLPATLNVADINSGEVVAQVSTGYDVEPYRIGFTPNNDLLLAYGTLEIWDMTSGQLTGRIVTQEAVRDFVFSRNGTRLVLLEADHVVRVLNLADRSELAVINTAGAQTWGLALSGDEKRLALGLDHSVALYDMP